MPDQQTAAVSEIETGPHRLSLLAGLAAMVVAAIRFLSGAGELDLIRTAMGASDRVPLVTIVWHSLTAIFFLAGLLTLLSAWRSRPYARATALFSAMIFAIVAVIMLTVAAGAVAAPTTFWPVIPLTVVALAMLAAWWKA